MAAKVETSRFLAGLKAELQNRRAEIVIGINEFASFVLGESQEEAPVKTGFLKASAFLQPATTASLKATIGFNADYALYVHENLEAVHSQGNAKFLERPVRANASQFVPYLAKKVGVT